MIAKPLWNVVCACIAILLPYAVQAQNPVSTLFKGGDILDSPYGITSHITWKGYDYDNYKFCLSKIVGTGAKYLRTDFNYTGIGWGKELLDFSIWDSIVSASYGNNISLAPIIYLSRYDNYTRAYGAEFRNYLSLCIERYGNSINHWELWNEMDQMYASDGKVSAKEYIPLLQEARSVIKQHNPSDKLVLGGIGDLGKSYFEELLAAGAAKYYDIANIHYYSARNIPEAILPFFSQLSSLLVKYNTYKPLWLTETGYSTFAANDVTDPDRFYTEVLPDAYNQLGIKCSDKTMGVLLDPKIDKYLRNQDNPAIYSGFRKCQAVLLDEIKQVNVEDMPVLMILFGESFPMVYFNDLEDYVRRGGTVVFPEGGAMLYYDLNLESNSNKGVGKSYYSRLHIDCTFTWDSEAKRKGIKTKMTSTKPLLTTSSTYHWPSSDYDSPKYLTSTHLKGNDKMIPLIEGTDGDYSGILAACYKLNSDLKGNVIIQTRSNLGYKISESLQAIRYPRLYLLSFASGVDKVFCYCLTDRSETEGGYGVLRKDLSEKPAYQTLKTMIAKLPSGSTRPEVWTEDNQYIAKWTNPIGKVVYAVWSDRIGLSSRIKVKGWARYYNDIGKRIRKRYFSISPCVTYIEGAREVGFEE